MFGHVSLLGHNGVDCAQQHAAYAGKTMSRITDIAVRGYGRWMPPGVALALVLLGTLTGFATFLVLTGIVPIRPSEQVISWLLGANAFLVAIMAILVAYQVAQLLLDLKRGTAGAGLHLRLLALFSVVAVVPALLVAVFAAVTLNRGLDSLFSERIQAIVNTASGVAEAYVENASQATRSDVANIAADLVQQLPMFRDDKPTYVRRVARHAALRNLAAAFVFDSQAKRVEVNVTANNRITFIAPTDEQLKQADAGELVLVPPRDGSNLIRAIIKLQGYQSHYLYIYRLVSPNVLSQLAATREAKAEYDKQLKQRLGVQLTYGAVFALLALVFLLAALWLGLRFSDRLVEPIVRLLGAARQVAQGNFEAKVATIDGPGDLMTLSRTFNMMTDQIRLHRDQLIATNEQLDARRRFSEAMLAGVSAGVVGVDPNLRVSIVNRSALALLNVGEGRLVGQPLAIAMPEFASLFEQAASRPSGFAEGQVEKKVRGADATFFARITTETSDDAEHGYVITFDDITNLVTAQRNSAWADIARRIAHEIKNPLTPIQLSAERLKRKYLKEIQSDRAVFEQCTDTIIRQVGDLGRIVDEFSSFARMPKAVPEPNDLVATIKDATVLQRVASSDIDILVNAGEDEIEFAFDRRLVTQAITNLVKNARESIEARLAEMPEPRGQIRVECGIEDSCPFVRVADNGLGLPKENRLRLAEPYMTTREKGTGLGLAIVKRIMEEHDGRLSLQDAENGRGAVVTLYFASVVRSELNQNNKHAQAV
jgi:two-component system nitrogen regulation sensor histidine kinase NtrY